MYIKFELQNVIAKETRRTRNEPKRRCRSLFCTVRLGQYAYNHERVIELEQNEVDIGSCCIINLDSMIQIFSLFSCRCLKAHKAPTWLRERSQQSTKSQHTSSSLPSLLVVQQKLKARPTYQFWYQASNDNLLLRVDSQGKYQQSFQLLKAFHISWKHQIK